MSDESENLAQKLPRTTSVLLVAVEEPVREYLQANFKLQWTVCQSKEEFEKNYAEINEANYAFVIAGSLLEVEFAFEVGQLISNESPALPLFYMTTDIKKVDRETLGKNGFSQVILYPVDQDIAEVSISQLIRAAENTEQNLRPVRIVDIEPNSKLPFNVFLYLPLNNRYLHFSRNNDELGKERYDRLQGKYVQSVFIKNHEFTRFYKYTADRITSLTDANQIEVKSENLIKLEEAVRSLFLDLFDSGEQSPEDGKKAIAHCKKVISTYITGGSEENLYSQLAMTLGSVTGQYSHASAVSVIVTLLGIGLNYPDPEELAIAGFYHDLSLWDLDDQTKFADPKDLSSAELENYHSHPEKSIQFLKDKKIIVSEETRQIILQHHESFDGKGFPQKIEAEKIVEGAQLLNFSDQIEYLTCFQERGPRYSLKDAYHKIAENNSINPKLIEQVGQLLQLDPPKTDIEPKISTPPAENSGETELKTEGENEKKTA